MPEWDLQKLAEAIFIDDIARPGKHSQTFASLRQTLAECQQILGTPYAQNLWDVSTYYDTIPL